MRKVSNAFWGMLVECSCQDDLTILPSSWRTNHNYLFFVIQQTGQASGRVWPISDIGMHKERERGISPGNCGPSLVLFTSGPQCSAETKRDSLVLNADIQFMAKGARAAILAFPWLEFCEDWPRTKQECQRASSPHSQTTWRSIQSSKQPRLVKSNHLKRHLLERLCM